MNKLSTFLLLTGFLFLLNACQQSRIIPTDSTKLNDSKLKLKEKNSKTEIPFNLSDYIPENFVLLDTAFGNLNLDEFPDMLLLLNRKDESGELDMDNPLARPLIILLGQKDKSFKEVKRCEKSVFCASCGGIWGDPYDSIGIGKEGTFYIGHYGGSNWRWGKTATFKYSKDSNDWLFVQEENESFHTGEPDKVERKVITAEEAGEMTFGEYDIYKMEE